MSNIIPIGGVTRLELPINTVLDGAKDALDGVILIGWNKKGEMHFASTYADAPEILWLLEQAKIILLEGGRDDT